MKSKYTNFKSGFFSPLHPEKYSGTTPIIFRSSLERQFMRWCDGASHVTNWTSESYIIPYLNPIDGKWHRYFCDNSITLKDKNGIEHKFLVEIKPKRKTVAPTESKKKSTATILHEKVEWVKFQSKSRAATLFAEKHNMKFIVLTEEDLGKLN